jgi:hypothetical protein
VSSDISKKHVTVFKDNQLLQMKALEFFKYQKLSHPATWGHSPEVSDPCIEKVTSVQHRVTYRVEEVASNKHHVQHLLEGLVGHQVCNTHNRAV